MPGTFRPDSEAMSNAVIRFARTRMAQLGQETGPLPIPLPRQRRSSAISALFGGIGPNNAGLKAWLTDRSGYLSNHGPVDVDNLLRWREPE